MSNLARRFLFSDSVNIYIIIYIEGRGGRSSAHRPIGAHPDTPKGNSIIEEQQLRLILDRSIMLAINIRLVNYL